MPSSPILGYSRCLKLINWRANPDAETTDWRTRRGRTAHRVRREGTASAVSYPYPLADRASHCAASPSQVRNTMRGSGRNGAVIRAIRRCFTFLAVVIVFALTARGEARHRTRQRHGRPPRHGARPATNSAGLLDAENVGKGLQAFNEGQDATKAPGLQQGSRSARCTSLRPRRVGDSPRCHAGPGCQ